MKLKTGEKQDELTEETIIRAVAHYMKLPFKKINPLEFDLHLASGEPVETIHGALTPAFGRIGALVRKNIRLVILLSPEGARQVFAVDVQPGKLRLAGGGPAEATDDAVWPSWHISQSMCRGLHHLHIAGLDHSACTAAALLARSRQRIIISRQSFKDMPHGCQTFRNATSAGRKEVRHGGDRRWRGPRGDDDGLAGGSRGARHRARCIAR